MTQEELEDDGSLYCWEEEDWEQNKLFYEYGLEYLEELPRKEKM